MGALGLVWATDWRLILHWVPYVNTKFKRGDELNSPLRAPVVSAGAASCRLHLEQPRLSGWTLGNTWQEFISSVGGNSFGVWT